MLQMKKEKLGGWLCLAAFACHSYIYVFWDNFTMFNLYYISIYSVLYCLGFGLSMVASPLIMKVASGLVMTVSGYCLYLEFAGEPWKWEVWQTHLGGLIILQGFLMVLIIEELKK